MTLAFLVSTHTIEGWLSEYGYIVVFVLVMLESLGLPVPGETALIAAALFAGSTGNLAIEKVIIVAAAAAIIGDNIGFAIGRYGGAKVLVKYGHKVRLHEGRLRIGIWLFRHHGGKVVFWGRFVAVLRTYAAFLAGANRMSWPRFLVFNTAGGILWAVVFGLSYYLFGDVLERLCDDDRHRARRPRHSRGRRVRALDAQAGGEPAGEGRRRDPRAYCRGARWGGVGYVIWLHVPLREDGEDGGAGGRATGP